jgi:hypothetical protein
MDIFIYTTVHTDVVALNIFELFDRRSLLNFFVISSLQDQTVRLVFSSFGRAASRRSEITEERGDWGHVL